MKTIVTGIVFVLFSITIGYGQIWNCSNGINTITGEPCTNTIITLTPFLNLPFNPQAASMGGSGIALSPSSTSLSLNSSNLAFIDSRFGIQTTYTPWLINILGYSGIYLFNTSGYGKIGERSTLGASFRYFSLGLIEFTGPNGEVQGSDRPNEWEALFSYNRKLSSEFSMGLSLKQIHSKLVSGQTASGNPISPINTTAGDVSFTYRKPLFMEKKTTFTAGLAIRNIGPKASYIKGSNFSDYLPTNLGVGIGFVRRFAKHHTLSFAFDLNRLLVPTPSNEFEEGDPDIPDFMEMSPIRGMLSSFGDAPSGLGEDFNENQYSFGVEYRYKYVIGRIGHFNEHKTKGNKKLLTFGVGARFKGIGLDFSYISRLNDQRIGETWRIGLSYDFYPKEIIPEVIN